MVAEFAVKDNIEYEHTDIYIYNMRHRWYWAKSLALHEARQKVVERFKRVTSYERRIVCFLNNDYCARRYFTMDIHSVG